jgi:hypothetical protein
MTKVNKNSKCSQKKNWTAVSKHWCKLKVGTNSHEDLNLMFANHSKEEKTYPLRTNNTLKKDSKSTKQRSIIKDLK